MIIAFLQPVKRNIYAFSEGRFAFRRFWLYYYIYNNVPEAYQNIRFRVPDINVNKFLK